jgi:hypothetical protein
MVVVIGAQITEFKSRPSGTSLVAGPVGEPRLAAPAAPAVSRQPYIAS